MRRKRLIPLVSSSLVCFYQAVMAFGQAPDSLIVDQSGQGQYKTVSEALAALPDFAYQRVVIFIRNGIYEEKIRITQNYVTLRGESRDSMIIRYYQKRTDWEANKDYIGPAVVNIEADDIILENLTVENTQPEIEPHAFAIYGKGTRIILRNCNLLGYGGDTVSLWNYQRGLYYHANCRFRGAVDMVCPRGWCYIRDSQFYEVKTSAAIWHDGHNDSEQKFVIVNSSFDGVPGFQLGRHHYDAQFYLIDCTFSENMADQPIYLRTYEDVRRNNPYLWGDRHYFYNCRKTGTAYKWYSDNLQDAVGQPQAAEITAAWTFAGRWDPESTKPVVITNYRIQGAILELTFNENVTVCGQTEFVTKSGQKFKVIRQRFTDNQRLQFAADKDIKPGDLQGIMHITQGAIIASVANINNRQLARQFDIIDR